jgi:nitroreductase
MDALDCINSRRSIRKYKHNKIPLNIVRKLIVAGMNAPSSFNDQPWVFVTIAKKATMEKLAAVKSQKSQFLKTAPLLIACCYDDLKCRAKSHSAENVAIAAENILLAAHALGLGACYIGAYDPNYPEIEKSIIDAIKLPKNVKVICLISVGYPDEIPYKKKMRKISEIWKKEEY